MNFTKQTKFIIAIEIQLVVLFAIIIFKSSVLIGGTEVLLKIEPVDPRDILRGDYVEFQYSDLSTIDFDSALFDSFSPKLSEGEKVYVPLVKSGKYWRAAWISRKEPSAGVFIKGIIDGIDSNEIGVIYGIEEYFIPENTGINFDFNKGEPYVKVAIDKNGSAVLRQLYVYDTPFEEYVKKYPSASPRQKSRDARRVSDTRQIQLGLELYFDENGHYPTDLNYLVEKSKMLVSLPKDPVSGNDYIYAYYPADNPDYYHLGAILEGYEQLSSDNDCDSSVKESDCAPSGATSNTMPYVNGFNGDDNGACGVQGVQGFCYDIIP